MGVRRTEYRRSYVKTPDKELANDFESKFDYRLLRRSEEHRHTPFEWDYSSENDSDYEEEHESREDERKRKAEEERLRQREERRNAKRAQAILEEEGNRRHRVEANGGRMTNKEGHARPTTAHESRPKRPVKPIAYRTIPKPAPLEPSSKRRTRHEACQEPAALFVPFGIGDKERETGALKTYNVRSGADVFPSALRARKRLESDVERREERARSRPYRESPQIAANQRMNKETLAWDSEYKNRYHGYEPGEYKRTRAVSGGTRFYVPL